jgi:hypothetical protein
MASNSDLEDDDAPLNPQVGIRRVVSPVTNLHLLARPMAAVDTKDKKFLVANIRLTTTLIEHPAPPTPDTEPKPQANFERRFEVMQPRRAAGGPVVGMGSMTPDFKAK